MFNNVDGPPGIKISSVGVVKVVVSNCDSNGVWRGVINGNCIGVNTGISRGVVMFEVFKPL